MTYRDPIAAERRATRVAEIVAERRARRELAERGPLSVDEAIAELVALGVDVETAIESEIDRSLDYLVDRLAESRRLYLVALGRLDVDSYLADSEVEAIYSEASVALASRRRARRDREVSTYIAEIESATGESVDRETRAELYRAIAEREAIA